MFEFDRALMGTEQPSFQQRDHAVAVRKQMFSLLLATLDFARTKPSPLGNFERSLLIQEF